MLHLHTARLRPSLLALAIVSTLPGAAFAAADEITVTATGNARSAFEAPMMVSVVDATAPEKQTASSAADLLRNVPGLTLDGTGRTNGQDVNLRGYDRRGVLVLVDGVRQGTDTGHLNSTFLDPALIKRIEVVRGPSALLYGSGALGGVISYDTVDAKDLLEPGKNQRLSRVWYRRNGGPQPRPGGQRLWPYRYPGRPGIVVQPRPRRYPPERRCDGAERRIHQ